MTPKSVTPRRQPKQSKLAFKPIAQSATATTPGGRKKADNANGSILNFFKKVEVEEQLFLPDLYTAVPPDPKPATFLKSEEDIYGAEDYVQSAAVDANRHPSKRRKLSYGASDAASCAETPKDCQVRDQEGSEAGYAERKEPHMLAKKRRRKGPFLVDSDTGSEDDETTSPTLAERASVGAPMQVAISTTGTFSVPIPPSPNLPVEESFPAPLDDSDPQLNEIDGQSYEFDNFDDIIGADNDEDGDDEFYEGEEYRERRFMEQQAMLEAEEAGDGMAQACPICYTSMDGITPDEATLHVNACLDGNPLPTPAPTRPPLTDTGDATEMSRRFAKAAVPRPGQANPISLGSSTNKPTSAFGRLMSGHAEDTAWASAAAAEQASRGKPAYKRTCPFYKIMPGFYICVDAFRYGAVQGCNAYFLSHFHSDHYIGLTANWSHGPIYCSRVTGSLIKSQLRTAAKYVKELKFEETVEVPGTEGVTVTMLPANHCPGSSLFLFEKRVGKGPNPKTQRILHCGDFRACPAQVAHPLLKPDVLDTVSGKLRRQKIDVCYLDTTYLNPRYSFPPQNDVIRTCAEFCKLLSGDTSTADDAFDRSKREKGHITVSSFFPKEKSDTEATRLGSESSHRITEGNPKRRLLVICGTYSIGKERICKAVAQALNTKIFASASKIKICSQLGDPELVALMTSNPYEAQVHMQMLMEIRAETLQDYLDSYKPHFTHVVGFRPSGWNFRSPTATAKNVPANTSPGSVSTTSILHGDAWRTRFGIQDLVAQRGSTREAMCFGVPYSEHSSFRELALFLMSLRIEKVIPTVNVGSEVSRKRMKMWTDRWLAERRKGGLVNVLESDVDDEKFREGRDDGNRKKPVLWNGKDGKGGGVYW
ncbi:DRMBL-domain-containing protein [Xylaria nigripes]|nr:DRMBL-domain-containing protein [Xylaria nigripes]